MKTSLWLPLVIVGALAGVIADRLVIGTTAHAQEPPLLLNIGGESVFIGMPKDTALAKFAGKYQVGNLDGNRVLIARSEEKPEKRFRSLGVLTFENGKLKSARRDWGDLWKGDEIEVLWNALHGVVAQEVGRISTMTFLLSFGSLGMRRILSSSSRF